MRECLICTKHQTKLAPNDVDKIGLVTIIDLDKQLLAGKCKQARYSLSGRVLVLDVPQLAGMHHEVGGSLEAGVIGGAQLRDCTVKRAV